jgi:hypothetical protein
MIEDIPRATTQLREWAYRARAISTPRASAGSTFGAGVLASRRNHPEGYAGPTRARNAPAQDTVFFYEERAPLLGRKHVVQLCGRPAVELRAMQIGEAIRMRWW